MIRRVSVGGGEIGTAGSLRIETFEGSRWRLRRTRSAMGFECHFGTHSTVMSTESMALSWPLASLLVILTRIVQIRKSVRALHLS